MCVRSIYFTSFNDFSIGFRNCSGTVIYFSILQLVDVIIATGKRGDSG